MLSGKKDVQAVLGLLWFGHLNAKNKAKLGRGVKQGRTITVQQINLSLALQ